MTAHVKVQVVLFLKSFPAVRTYLSSLPVVTQFVSCQTRAGTEEFPTLHALVGLFRRMALLVASEFTHAGVGFPALFALENTALGVSELVLSQQVHFLEAFPTLGTGKPLDLLRALVSKPILNGFKAVAALDANICRFCALHAPVSGHV